MILTKSEHGVIKLALEKEEKESMREENQFSIEMEEMVLKYTSLFLVFLATLFFIFDFIFMSIIFAMIGVVINGNYFLENRYPQIIEISYYENSQEIFIETKKGDFNFKIKRIGKEKIKMDGHFLKVNKTEFLIGKSEEAKQFYTFLKEGINNNEDKKTI